MRSSQCPTTSRISELREIRALDVPEIELSHRLDGAHTVRNVIASGKIEAWRQDYNEHHPHRALKGLSPNEYARRVVSPAAESLTSWPEKAGPLISLETLDARLVEPDRLVRADRLHARGANLLLTAV